MTKKRIKKTLYLDKDIVQAVKFYSVEKNKTESDVVNDSLREKMQGILKIFNGQIPRN